MTLIPRSQLRLFSVVFAAPRFLAAAFLILASMRTASAQKQEPKQAAGEAPPIAWGAEQAADAKSGKTVAVGYQVWKFIEHKGNYKNTGGIGEWEWKHAISPKLQSEVLFRNKEKADTAWKTYVNDHKVYQEQFNHDSKVQDPEEKKRRLENLLGVVDKSLARDKELFGLDYLGQMARLKKEIQTEQTRISLQKGKGKVDAVTNSAAVQTLQKSSGKAREEAQQGRAEDAAGQAGKAFGEAGRKGGSGQLSDGAGGPASAVGAGTGQAVGGAMRARAEAGMKEGEVPGMEQKKPDDRWWITKKLDEAKAQMVVDGNHGDLTGAGGGDPKLRLRQEEIIKTHPEEARKALDQWAKDHPETSPDTLAKSKARIDQLDKQRGEETKNQGKTDDRGWWRRLNDRAMADGIVGGVNGDLSKRTPEDVKRQEQFVAEHPEDIRAALERTKKTYPEAAIKKSEAMLDAMEKKAAQKDQSNCVLFTNLDGQSLAKPLPSNVSCTSDGIAYRGDPRSGKIGINCRVGACP